MAVVIDVGESAASVIARALLRKVGFRRYVFETLALQLR